MTDAREIIKECIKDTKGWRGEGGPDAITGHILAALSAAGLVIVPKEPTPAMVRVSTMMAPTWDDHVSRAKWRAMVGAATDE